MHANRDEVLNHGWQRGNYEAFRNVRTDVMYVTHNTGQRTVLHDAPRLIAAECP